MANTFLRKISRNIGNTAVTVGDYTVGANIGAVVVGLGISNTIASQVHANVSINNGTDDFYLVKSAPIFDSSTLILVGNEQKIVLQTGDSIKVTSSDSSSLDVVMTIMETDGVGITSDPITYSITSNISSVGEGNTVGFTVSTSNVPNSTVLYWTTVGNVSSADFSDSVTSGNVTVSNGSATITRTLVADATTEGVEYFDLELRTGSTSGTIVATSANVIVNDTSSNPPALNEAYYAGYYYPGITSGTTNRTQVDTFTLLPNISAISDSVGGSSASSYHFTYIKTDGTWWYYSPNGLGLGSTDQYTPSQVDSGAWDYVALAFDSEHMFGINSVGELYAAGNNSNGQLGLNDTTTRSYSNKAKVGSATNWTKACGAKSASIGLRSDGTVWCWGLNSGTQAGQLGVGGTTDVLVPTQVGTDTNWVDIAAAPSRGTVFYGLKSNGTLWLWGDAASGGGLGTGNTLYTIPTQVGVATNWAKIYGAYRSLRAIKTNGTLWGGYSASSPYGSSFQQVGTDTDWAITAGSTYTWHAIKNNGTLWAISVYNFYGAAGTGNTTDVLVPTQIGSDTNWRMITPTNQFYGVVAIK
jgi:hypothetical protein